MPQLPEREPFDRHESVRVSQEPDDGERLTEPTGDLERRERVVQDFAAERQLRLAKITELIWLLTGLLEGLIAIRIFLRLVAANSANPFAAFVYGFTSFFLWPFFGLTGNPGMDGMVLEVSSLIGMAFYALLAWVVIKLIWVVFAPTSAHTVSTYDRNRG